MSVTRRTLIRGLVATFGLVPPSAVETFGGRAGDARRWLARASGEPETAPLTQAEIEVLVAFAEVLVEGRALLPVERGYLVDHITTRTTQGAGYYLSLYRTTVRFLDRLAGARFSSLDVAQRAALITRHRLAAGDVRPGEPPGPAPEEARAVRTRVVRDLIGGYYGSPAGWAAVGYDVFPGRCGELARYTRPEA